ncbi:MAG: hypothetical protein LBH00_11680, partial [Planctomycetaceae bacterium]|nr:hypothetical protein [Planctomycetaceae bacterium]
MNSFFFNFQLSIINYQLSIIPLLTDCRKAVILTPFRIRVKISFSPLNKQEISYDDSPEFFADIC